MQIGNQLNADARVGDEEGGVAGFTFASLTKLNEAKAYDQKTSILHYLVMLVKRNDEALLNFKEDLASIGSAERINLESTFGELGSMDKGLSLIRSLAVEEAKELKEGSGGRESDINLRLSIEELSKQHTKVRQTDGNLSHFDVAFPLDELMLTPIGRFSIDASHAMMEALERGKAVKSKVSGVSCERSKFLTHIK